MSIPPAKQPAVDRALMAAFGTTEVDSVATVSGGLSGALTYRIRVRSRLCMWMKRIFI